MLDVNTCVYPPDRYLETLEESKRTVVVIDLIETLMRHIKNFTDSDITTQDSIHIVKFLIEEYLLSVRQEESLDDFLVSLTAGNISMSFLNYAKKHSLSFETAGFDNAYEFMQDVLESEYYGSLISDLNNTLPNYTTVRLSGVPVKWDIRFGLHEVFRFKLWIRIGVVNVPR